MRKLRNKMRRKTSTVVENFNTLSSQTKEVLDIQEKAETNLQDTEIELANAKTMKVSNEKDFEAKQNLIHNLEETISSMTRTLSEISSEAKKEMKKLKNHCKVLRRAEQKKILKWGKFASLVK